MTDSAMEELRAASLSLRIDAALSAMPGMAGAVSGELALVRYHHCAEAVGVSREQADEILRAVQGEHAGSTPSTDDLAEATRRLGEAAR